MNNVLVEIVRLVIELKERPSYEEYEDFIQEVADLIPIELWEGIESNIFVPEGTCTNCHGIGFTQEYSVREEDYGRTWIEDCGCIVKYEAELEEQYQAHLAEKSAESERMEGNSEANVEKVD